MDYLIIKCNKIADFLGFLNPLEQVQVMCIEWNNIPAYRVSGLHESFMHMIQREHGYLIA